MTTENISDALPFERLTIIGLGLIGGSIAMAAKEAYPSLWIQGVDPDEETLQFALRNDLIDKASRTPPEFFEENHGVLLACHLGQSLSLLNVLAPRISGKAVWISDVGSCKRKICQLGAALLPDQFIGGHPMAGREFSGIRHATSLLFAGKPYILISPGKPSEPVENNALTKFKRFVTQALRAEVQPMDAETHDWTMALVSHVPQLYAVMLSRLLLQNQPGRLASVLGGGIRDQLRLAASPFGMWSEILEQNSDNIHKALLQMTDVFKEGEGLLDSPDAMAEWFRQANQLHQAFFHPQS